MKMMMLKLAVPCLTVVLAGCVINPPAGQTRSGSAKVECFTITPVIDGTSVTPCVVDSMEIDERTGKNVPRYNRSVHLFEAQPTMAGVVRGVTAGTGAAYIQGEAAKSIARKNKCGDGANCGTILAPSSAAYADSYAGSKSGVDIDVRSGNLGKFAQ